MNILRDLRISQFSTSNVKNMSSMFKLCSSLGTIDVSNFITSNVVDMSSLFD